jgi:hypothetical protein
MSRFWTYLIAILEIVGGICGLAFIVWQSLTAPLDRYNLLLAVIISFVYLLSLGAGIALALGYKFGRVASIIVQAIQLPKYTSQLLVFMFSFGFDAYVYGMLTNSSADGNSYVKFGLDLKFLAYYQLLLNVSDAPAGFGISIPACAFLVMLLRKRTLTTSQETSAVGGDAPNKSLDASGGSASRN